MFARWFFAFGLLAVQTGSSWASGLLPDALPQDVRSVQACLASRSGDLAAACIGVTARACLKPGDGPDRTAQCLVRERAVWDLFLNNDYQGAMMALYPAARRELTAIEREWVVEMERRCAFIRTAAPPAATPPFVEVERCKLNATATQWLWLRELPMKREKER